MYHRTTALAAALAAVTVLAACGEDDETPVAAKKAKPAAATAGKFDGSYELELSRSAARKIPDPSIVAGTYVLTLEKGTYNLGNAGAPYGNGRSVAKGNRLTFTDSASSAPCGAAAGSYRVSATGTGLRFSAVEDGCEERRAFFDGRTWKRG